MADATLVVFHQHFKPIKIIKWKIRRGMPVSINSVVVLYEYLETDKAEQHKFRSPQAGTVSDIIAKEGAIIQQGEPLFEVQPCIHSTVMKDMCAECGADLRKDEINSTASVPMIHTVPELKVTQELAEKLGRADGDRLLKDNKLVLLVDLDQTLIHTTNDNIPANMKDVYHFQLNDPPSAWYHTRLRPGTIQFLHNISIYFELHICTFGVRNYAHRITGILDPDGKLFSNRVLSRDECFDPTSKRANLKALFPCGDQMVCIIDDREDVWSYASNLIHVKPYHFFKHTGDINAPPGLEKHENDEKDDTVESISKNENNETIENKENMENSESIENMENSESIENKENMENSEIIENKENMENSESIENNENLENIENNENTENYESVENNAQEVPTSDNIDKSSQEGSSDCKSDTNNAAVNGVNETTKDVNDVNQEEEEKIKLTEKSEEVESMKVEDEEKIDKAEPSNLSENVENAKADEKIDKPLKVDSQKNSAESLINPQNMIDGEDPDDYLLYLEDILKRIHKAFYEEYGELKPQVPDLKIIVPAVKKRILKGCNLIFSGLVPTHMRLEDSKAFQVARSLGANVVESFDESTTHLVAVRPGTVKVNNGKKRRNLKIVTPDWLWTCAERWEHVDEQIFPLSSKGSKNRHPPPHCSSPEHTPSYDSNNSPALRKRSPSGRFMDSINPLMSFSSADIADMDKEVAAILDDDDSESEDDVSIKPLNEHNKRLNDDDSSSNSDESLTADFPRLHKRRRFNEDIDDVEFETDTKDTDDLPSTKFRRGEELESDLDIGQNSNTDDNSLDAADEIDDREWNMMGAALEREFLE